MEVFKALLTIIFIGFVLGLGFKMNQPDVEVGMTNRLQFEPKSVKIAKGETVLWKNSSALVHTVTCDPKEASKKSSVKLPSGAEPFNSGRLQPDQKYEHTFKKRGTYKYFCIPHEGSSMVGKVIVK